MKGLLMKDLMLMKNQKQFLGVISFIGFVFIFFYENLTFTIDYIMIMFAMFTISTISYDEYDNGYAYLFALPVNRKTYVQEKYIFGMLISGAALLLVSAVIWLSLCLRDKEYPAGEWGVSVFAGICVIVMFLGLCIPVQLKFGADKCRIVLMIVAGGIAVGGCILVKFGPGAAARIVEMLKRLEGGGNILKLVVICAVVMAGILFVSYFSALHVMERKEF